MNFAPIIVRELRVRARQVRLRWGRVILAALALLIVTWLLLLPQWFGARMPASLALVTSFQLAFVVAFFMGARLTADAFSQEYRDNTLGLLLLSHLRGWEIAVGKLTSNTLTALYSLLAAVPMLSIPLLAGGATGMLVLRLALATLNGLVCSAAVGLFFSSLTPSGRKAWSLSLLTLLALLFGWRALSAIAVPVLLARGISLPEWVLLLSPTALTSTAMQIATTPGGGRLRTGFWMAMGIQQVVAWGLVLMAGFIATRRSVERPAGRVRWSLRERWQHWRLGSTAKRRARRQQELDVNPFAWLVNRYRFRSFWPLVLVLAPMAGGTALWIAFPSVVEPLPTAVGVVLIIHLVLKFHFAAEAVMPVLAERRAGTVELLLSTPLNNRQLMRGQLRAMTLQFGPALSLALLATLGVLGGLVRALSDEPELVSWSLALPLAAAVALLADCWTMTWVGMWCATWKNVPRKAAGNTTGFVLLLPWLLLIVASMGFGFLIATRGATGSPPNLWIWFGLWALVGFGNNLFWLVLTRRILTHRLRALLGRPVAPSDL